MGWDPKRRDGFVVVTTVLSLFFIMGFAALAIDLGVFRFVRRTAQNAADAGAVGAAMAMAATPPESGITAGRLDASKNGFTHGTDGVTVAVNSPPTMGFYSGNSGFVEVIVTQPRPTLFMNALGIDSATISARAVGYVEESGSGCVYVMDPVAKLALTLTGGSTLSMACGIYINSNHPEDAMNVGSSSTVNAGYIGVVGGTDIHPDATVTPTPVTGIDPLPDPLDGQMMPEPPPGGWDCSEHGNSQVVCDSGTCTYTPGTYCGGIKVASSGTLAIFEPGMYILMSKGLLIKGGADAQGAGVTFYATSDATHSFLGYNITGGSNTNFSAPTSGDYAGMLFMTDRTVYNTKQNHIGGHSNTVIDGTIYMPGTPLVYNGGSTGTGNYTLMVASTLEVGGGSVINSNYGGLPAGESIIRVGVLVE